MASARIRIAASEASNWPGDSMRIVLDQLEAGLLVIALLRRGFAPRSPPAQR